VPASPATPAPAPAPATSVMKLPPASANIPAPPQGFVPTNGADYRGLLPKKTELAVLPDAVGELKRFTNFSQAFGKTMPPLAVVLATLDAAEQWSSMRAKSTEWDLFSRTQEGLAWKDARDLIATMRPAFNMATSVDSTIATENPSITRLLDAATAIAQRAAATRKANRLLKQQGKLPTAGKVGKKVKKAAEAATAAANAPHVVPATAAPTPPATAPAEPAPAVTIAPTPVVSAPAAVTTAPVTNSVANGAAH
jgi:hypothetical protein